MECQVSAQLRDSLNVFVPPAAEWRDTRFMDVGGPEGLRRPDAQACVDLAYCLSHQVVICVPFDLTDSQAALHLICSRRRFWKETTMVWVEGPSSHLRSCCRFLPSWRVLDLGWAEQGWVL